MHLKNRDSAEILASYEITIVPTSYENEENAFNYSIKSFEEVKSKDLSDASEKNTAEERATTEESDAEDTDNTEDTEDSDDDGSSAERISRSDALDKAREYLGDEVEYSYRKIETIGDKDYYDFKVEGEDLSITDVLVSVDGNDVVGGTRNDDDSWSFDQ